MFSKSTQLRSQTLKVAVLNEPYFPLQKLVIRLSPLILKSLDVNIQMQESGQQFGIVCKMESSYRSHALVGTLCEIKSLEQSSIVLPRSAQLSSNSIEL